MTDTTDMAELPKMTLEELLIRCTDYDDGSLSMDAGELKMLNQHISLLEAERQRADALQGQLDYRNEVLTRAIRQREAAEADTEHYRKAWKDKADELAELKGDQVPVAYLTRHMGCRSPDDCEEYLEVSDKDGVSGNGEPAIPVFTAPQKPIVLLPPAYEKSADFTEYHQGWNACRNYMLAEAKEVGGSVKDGE